MTGALIVVACAVTLPPAAGWLGWKRFGLTGWRVVQAAAAAGVAAASSVRGDYPGIIAAAVIGVLPWLTCLPVLQRRITGRRLARFGGAPATLIRLAYGGPSRREPGGPPRLASAAADAKPGRITSVTAGVGCIRVTSPAGQEHPDA